MIENYRSSIIRYISPFANRKIVYLPSIKKIRGNFVSTPLVGVFSDVPKLAGGRRSGCLEGGAWVRWGEEGRQKGAEGKEEMRRKGIVMVLNGPPERLYPATSLLTMVDYSLWPGTFRI